MVKASYEDHPLLAPVTEAEVRARVPERRRVRDFFNRALFGKLVVDMVRDAYATRAALVDREKQQTGHVDAGLARRPEFVAPEWPVSSAAIGRSPARDMETAVNLPLHESNDPRKAVRPELTSQSQVPPLPYGAVTQETLQYIDQRHDAQQNGQNW